MVTEYEDRQITRSGHNGTRYVLATDYAALEAELAKEKEGSRCFELTAKGCVRALEHEKKELAAERDEWKRRCKKIIGHAYAHTLDSWTHDIITIAEGGDNG